MSRDGSGNYNLVSGNPVVTGTVIASTWANQTLSDIASALTQSLSKDGQTTPTANLTMGNFRLTALASAIARTDAVNAGQIQDGGLVTLTSVTGTDTITASSAPAITAYTAGQSFDFLAAGANTTNAVTLNINTLGAKAVMKMSAASGALVQIGPGDFHSGQSVRVRYDGTQFQVISPLSPTSAYTLRNKFINGDFSLWQRGTSFSAGGGIYTADRWIAAAGAGGGAMTVTRQPTTVGDPLAASQYYVQLAQTVAATTVPNFNQRIESVSTFSNRFVTLTVVGYVASGTLSVTPQTAQNFGTGGSPSTTVQTNYPPITLTTSEQAISTTFQVPSIAGKTLGTNGDDYLVVGVAFPISTTFTASILSLQVEDGTAPTPFEKRPPQVETALSQRYYQTGSSKLAGYALNGTAVSYFESFPVTMRATPTGVVASSTNSGGISATNSVGQINSNGIEIQNTTNASSGFVMSSTWTASAEL